MASAQGATRPSATFGVAAAALMTAVVTVFTAAVQIRNPASGGYFNLSDVAVVFAGIAVLVATLHAVERLAMALEARGFGGPARRTSLRTLRMRPADWLALALVVAVAGAVIWARLALGFGTRPLGAWPWPMAAG
jgi:hypothetical protein